MKVLTLACGRQAKVDDEDFEYLNQFNWCLHGQAAGMKYAVISRMGLKISEGKEADHIDRDSLNNQRGNLRVVTKSANNINVINPLNTSGHSGVDSGSGELESQETRRGSW